MPIDPHENREALGRNLTYGLLDRLGSQIVGHAYEGRSFPTEAELSQQHGVSRSVTREAVKMLTAKGLVTARPRQGTMIQPVSQWNLFDTDVLRWMLDRSFSIDLLKQFSQLRVAIEPAAAALAAQAADDDGRALIEAGFARMQAAEAGRDDVLEADVAFHVAILKASGNPFFGQFRDVVSTALKTSIRYTNRIVGRSGDLDAHEGVMEAILARDPQRARERMERIIVEALVAIDHNESAANRV
ncbi:GntR family transcriptional regulator [Novosphingobium sp. PhB165]|uniref:FadR/GntR family transcriptional regulator n=1 Tax=Novosphingobium sp. PhB165 TaxID=2485105 RepID=UPI0010433246|nr:FCD domain-containing protein [Novosphingobium sp. PhB165]TCM17880.1 GntR family transcriptional regulator [Novosphingobium sp. PhB165]